MRAADLRLSELVEFGEGVISLQGRRLVLHDLHALALMRKDLAEAAGPDHARRLLTRFGYFWGQADAAAMQRVFQWDDRMELLRAGAQLHTLQGVAKTVVRNLEWNETEGKFFMEVVWHNSAEAEKNLIALGPSRSPSCWVLTGYASGYASYCLNAEIYFIEQKCMAQGDRICSAIGRDRKSWGDEVVPHLSYFRFEGITGEVTRLTQELRRRTAEVKRQRLELDKLRPLLQPPLAEAHSAAFRRVLDMAARLARFDTSVLITGETGTGKEVVARYIHQLSARAKGPFIGVNCGALPETLLESELFGHKAGSFTGAVRDRVGLFEQANRGTIFLDEIGDITPAMQLKLLRVLQEREILRVGESQPRKIDVRVIAATNRNLEEAVANGRFREDLLYRLRVVSIPIPPLRERREDILSLARLFLQRVGAKLGLNNLRLDASCLDLLTHYPWPGNVRELENAMEHAAVFATQGVVLPEHLPPHIAQTSLSAQAPVVGTAMTLEEMELAHIRAVLAQTHGHRAEAARRLGISTATLWRKLKQTSLPPSSR